MMPDTEIMNDLRQLRIRKRRRDLGFAWVVAGLSVALLAGCWLAFLGIVRLIDAAASVWIPG